MLGDVIRVGQPPFFAHLLDESPLDTMARHLLQDEMMEAVREGVRPEPDFVFCPSTWMKPRSRWCPYKRRRLTGPPRPTRQHLLILPRLTYHAMDSGEPSWDKATLHSSKDKESNSHITRKRTPSTHSDSSQDSTHCTKSYVGNHCTSTYIGNTGGDSPWQFSVDMKGCDEVRAMTEKGMLVVEGRGSSDTSQQIVRYITSMLPHVSHDSLTATLNNGCLTVTQKKAHTQLEGQPRTLNIDVHQQQQQQQESTEQNKQQQEQQQAQQSTNMTQQKE